MSKRRTFSEEFKRETVGLTRQPGVTISQVAREIGVGVNLLARWRGALGSTQGKVFPGSGVSRDEEMMKLKRELARVGADTMD